MELEDLEFSRDGTRIAAITRLPGTYPETVQSIPSSSVPITLNDHLFRMQIGRLELRDRKQSKQQQYRSCSPPKHH